MSDKTCVIIGAGEGLGQALAKKFAQEQFNLALVSRSEKGSQVALDEARKAFKQGEHSYFFGDALQPESIAEATRKIANIYGNIDVLIYNVRGNYELKEPLDMSFSDLENIYNLEVVGAFAAVKMLLPRMIKQKHGKIFSISTSLKTMIGTGLSPYGASKAGLELTHITWSRELKEHNIDVNILLPGGASDTDFIPESMVPGEVGKRQDKILPGDIIVPPAVWLCTNETNGVTGRRIIAKYWDQKLPPKESFEKCLQPIHENPEIM